MSKLIYFQSIPGRGSSRQKGIRTLSESEERQIDEAIELANSYAMKGTSDHLISTSSPKSVESLSSHGDSDCNSSLSSPKGKSVFSLRKKVSPKQERKTFTDEIASISDASEDVSAEAQEAYNLLIVRGSIKEGKDKDGSSRSNSTGASREFRRMQHRVKDPVTSSESSSNEKLPVLAPRANRNIRAPQGIPGRSFGVSEPDEVPDSNPLRRLRASAVIPPKTKPKPNLSDRAQNNNARNPNLSANLPFFDKLKEQELSQDSGECSEEGINPVPLPPRCSKTKSPNLNTSAKTFTNSKPRQRKYPLNLSNYKDAKITTDTVPIVTNFNHQQQARLSPDKDHLMINSDLNVSRDSDDSVFSSCSPNSSLERHALGSNAHSIDSHPEPTHQVLDSPFSVKSVTLSAKDLGYHDTSDLFWAKPVNLEDFGSSPTLIPGRYKTSDTVSYEDLLEFALDGVSERYFMLRYVLSYSFSPDNPSCADNQVYPLGSN